MSSVIVLNDYHKDFPLIIGLNRHSSNNNKFSVEPIDNQYIGIKTENIDGTWLGINKSGIFATMTGNESQLEFEKLLHQILSFDSIDKIIEFLTQEKVKDNLASFQIIFGNKDGAYVASSHYFQSFLIQKLPKGITIVKDVFPANYSNNAASLHRIFDLAEKDQPWIKYYSFIKERLKEKYLNDSVYGYGKNLISSAVLAFNREGLKRIKIVNRKEKPARYKDYIDLYRETFK